MADYGNRVIALLDILGFKDIVLRHESGADQYPELPEVLSQIKNWQVPGGDVGTITIWPHRQSSVFSDHIVISHDVTGDGVIQTIMQAALVAYLVLILRVPVRGAITIGPLRHDDRMILGSAMIRAHDLESNHAIYPRIIVDQSVIDALRTPEGDEAIRRKFPGEFPVRQDRDGVWFVPILDEGYIQAPLRSAWSRWWRCALWPESLRNDLEYRRT